MNENSVSFQMFLILLSFITLGSESQISLFKQSFSEKKNLIRHFARFNFSRLSLAFTSKYYPILHVMKR